MQGFEVISQDKISGTCRNVLPYVDNQSAQGLVLGTETKLYVWQSNVLYDITPTGLPAGFVDGAAGSGYGSGGYGQDVYGTTSGGTAADLYARTWSLGSYGQSTMACPRGGMIYWWQNVTSTVAAPLTNAPTKVNYMISSAKRRQVIAFGCKETVSGNYNPLCIRGSDVDGQITTWTPSQTNNAFENVLSGGAAIVAAREWGDLFAVWTRTGLIAMVPTGSTQAPFSFSPIGGSTGLLGPNAASCVGDYIYWISPDLQVWRCALGGAPEQIECPILDQLRQLALGQGDKVVMSYSTFANELRIDYPDQRDGFENSRYLTLCLTDGSWSQGRQARTAYHLGAPLPYPVGVAPPVGGQSSFYYHERGRDEDGGAITWSLETSDFALDEDVTCQHIRGVWPDFRHQVGTIRLTLTGLMTPQDPNPQVWGPYDISAGMDRVDLRASAKIWRIRLEGSSAPASMRMGRMIMDIVPAGTR